ncbi:MAG TPA: DNA polymerase III subunit epsilon [Rhizomicrobium sp.]|nr:DNA polymerase III subunit epsilon [Rhizomicrobium sp.]
MREIVLDTETTGLDPTDGHRIIEIGCVELYDHVPTGDTFHRYLNPERDIPMESQRVHGITEEFVADKPLFAHVVDEMLEFLGDAPLVIHNAGFDLKFLNAELQKVSRPLIPFARAIDTIDIAKAKIPGARYSLDELCRRFSIDLTSRSKHGALLDASLLAQVYLELIGGRQTKLMLSPSDVEAVVKEAAQQAARTRPTPLAPRISDAELEAHAKFVIELGADAIWNQA